MKKLTCLMLVLVMMMGAMALAEGDAPIEIATVCSRCTAHPRCHQRSPHQRRQKITPETLKQPVGRETLKH